MLMCYNLTLQVYQFSIINQCHTTFLLTFKPFERNKYLNTKCYIPQQKRDKMELLTVCLFWSQMEKVNLNLGSKIVHHLADKIVEIFMFAVLWPRYNF